MLTKKFLSALTALIVILLLLPSAALAQETPITAAEIAGTWSGDAVLKKGTAADRATVPFSMTIAEDGTGTVTFSTITFPISYADGIIRGSIQRGAWRNSFNATVNRHAGEIIIEGEYIIVLNENSEPVVLSWKGTKIDETVAKTQPPEEEPSGEDEIPVLIGSTPEATETPAPSPTPTWSWRTYQATATESAVRFGDLWGEVNVRPNDEDDDAYIFAELSTPLHHNDRIKTLTRSGAILSFSDMSTFVMKEDTIIVLDIATEHKSKIMMVAGNVWTNLKKMWTDGSMEIEMNQAVAGIKGTTLICEEANGVSTLKVLEGTVEFTSKATGEAVLVSGGQMVNADEDGLGEIKPFDIEKEMEGWHETAQQITADALKKNTGGRVVYVIIGAALALGAVTLVLTVVLLHVLGRKRSPVPAAASYDVPRHCTRCGNTVPPGSAFCAACGAPQPAPVPSPGSYGQPPKKSPALLIIGIVAAMLMLCCSVYLLFFAGQKSKQQTSTLSIPIKTAAPAVVEPIKIPVAVDYATTRDVADLIGVWAGELEYTDISGDWTTFGYPVSEGYTQPFMLKIREDSPELNWRQAILRIDGGDAAVLNAGFEWRFLEIRGEWQSCDVSISVEYDETRGGFVGIGEYIHSEKHAAFDFFMAAADEAVWNSGDISAAMSPPSTQAAMVSNKTITVNMDYDSGNGVYSGEVDGNGMPNGQGRFTMQQSDTGENWSYEGQWVSGQITGKGVMTQGDFIFMGSFISGLMDGDCEITDSGVLRYKGMCSGGKLHGEGTLYTKSGTLIFEGAFENDMMVESAADRKKRGEAFMPECVAMDTLLYDVIMDGKDAMDYPVSVWGFPIAMSEQQATGTIAIEHIADDSYPVCLVYRYGVNEPKMTWDDWINAWGVVIGTYEYEDEDGLTVTCPKIEVIYWDNVYY